jgi:hypothetical protein
VNDVTVYLVLNDYRTGLAYVETALDEADRETAILNFLSGQYGNALRVVAFNAAEGWSQDVSEEVARRHAVRGHQAVHRSARDPGREAATRAVCKARTGSSGPQEGVGRIDFRGQRRDTAAMGVRTRGLDIKASAAKLKADRAALARRRQ